MQPRRFISIILYTYLFHGRPSTFKIMAMGDPFTSDLRFVVRVFTAPHEQLTQFFDEKGGLVGVHRLVVPWQRSDEKALDFLEKRWHSQLVAFSVHVMYKYQCRFTHCCMHCTLISLSLSPSPSLPFPLYRCQLLLQAYKTTIEEDNALLMGGAKSLSPCSVIAVKMRLSEKKILYNAMLFARTLRERLLSQPPQSQNGGNPSTMTMSQSIAAGAFGAVANVRSHSPPVIVELGDEETGQQFRERVASEGEDDGREEERVEEGGGEDVKINGDMKQLELGTGEKESEGTEKTGEEVELTQQMEGDAESERETNTGGGSDDGGGGEPVKTDLEQTSVCVNGTKI